MGFFSIVSDLLSGQKSIRVAGFTITRKKDNTTVIRTSKNRKKNKNKRSPKQKAWSATFGKHRKFFKAFRAAVMDACPTWDACAKWMIDVAHSDDNCCHSVNYKYITADHEVGCPPMFHFSLGELGMPWDMEVKRVNDIVMFTWHDERDFPHAHGTDRLLVGILYDDFRDRPVLVDTRATREKGAASIELDPQYGSKAHLYPYFERVDRTAYSEDQYFEV